MKSIIINDRLMTGCTMALYGDQVVLSDVNYIDAQFLMYSLVFGAKLTITEIQQGKKTTYSVIYMSNNITECYFMLCEITKNEPNNITVSAI